MRVRYVGRLAARHLSRGDRALPRIVLVSPFPRRYELSAPDASLCRLRLSFLRLVRAAGKFEVVEREPLADEPSAKVTVSHGARRDDATVSIVILRLAHDGLPFEMSARQTKCGRAVPDTSVFLAYLCTLDRVDAPEADARAADVDRIAVDDRRWASDGLPQRSHLHFGRPRRRLEGLSLSDRRTRISMRRRSLMFPRTCAVCPLVADVDKLPSQNGSIRRPASRWSLEGTRRSAAARARPSPALSAGMNRSARGFVLQERDERLVQI